mgnify:CR=1 FL=1
MFKFTVFVLSLTLVSAQIGPGVEDARWVHLFVWSFSTLKVIFYQSCPPNITPDPPLQLNDPTDCRRFFKCENGLAVPFECPEGQHWSVRWDLCDWPNRANCVLELPLECPKENPPFPEEPIHLPHPTDCTQFFKCDWGVPRQLPCPPGQHFSIELDRCDWPEVANCDRGNGGGDGGGGGGGSKECDSKEKNSKEKCPKNSKENKS